MHGNPYRKQFAIFYFGCFAIYFGWLFFNNLLLSQFEPVFFLNKLDLSRNFLMLTNLQHAVIENPLLQQMLDFFFILLPGALLIGVITEMKFQHMMALAVSIFNFVYAMTISSMSVLSIEAYVGWILIPLVFTWRTNPNYKLMVDTLRYFLILIFASAACWKIRGGGLFYPEQMAGILLKQHTAFLVAEPTNWFSQFVFFMSRNYWLSWSLYAFATLAELFYLAGFFTKKYDRLLVLVFIGFVAFNYFFMRINYFSWIAFLGCFYFAREHRKPSDPRHKPMSALKGTYS